MNKRFYFLMISIITVMASAGAHASKKKHEEKFCAALDEFHSDLKMLQAMGPSSTLQEFHDASERVAKDANKVEKEGGKINTPTAKRFKGAARQLRMEARSLPENITIEQAQSRISDGVQNVRQSARALATESGCSETS